MPVRPRHCNGQFDTRAPQATDFGREGERRGPEPGDDSSSAPRTHALGGGAGGTWAAQSRARRICPGIFLQEDALRASARKSNHRRRDRGAARGIARVWCRLSRQRPRQCRASASCGRGAASDSRRLRRHAAARVTAPADRLAQPRDHRTVLRAWRRRPSRRPHALRSVSRRGEGGPGPRQRDAA